MKIVVVTALLFLLALASPVQADETAELIADANVALSAGDYQNAEIGVRRVLALGLHADQRERAEAFRILGLLKFFQDAKAEARAAFLEYLRLDLDGHLDPAMFQPEVITLLEDVRATNAAELDSLRPRPKKKRYVLLNLVPAGGQFQNGERTKGFLIAGGMVALAAANISTYLVLRDRCSSSDRTCSNGASSARDLQSLNLVSGLGLVSLYVYSVFDGYLGYRRQKRQHDMSLGVVPYSNGVGGQVFLRF